LKSASTLSALGWDISNVGGSSAVWRIYDGQTSPLLRSFLTSMTVAGNGTAVYDGNTNVTSELGSTYTSNSNLLNTASLSMIASSKDVGTRTVTTSGSLYSTQLGYDISYATGSVTITPANLVVSGISAQNKVYDATTSATLSGTASVTPIGADAVNVTGTGVGNFLDKNVGTTKSVVVTGYSLAGADAGNYAVVQPAGVTANISKASLVVSGVTAADKVYDATTTAILSGGAVTALGTDALSLNTAGATGQFVNANAGLSKNIIATGYILGGADVNNYDLQQPSGVTANIGRATVTVSGATAEDKTYDGTTTATVKGGTLSGLVGSETLVLTQSGSFTDKNVGNNKTVNENFAIADGSNGGLASNYQLASTTSTTTASIAALPDTTASTSKSRDVGNLNELAKSSIFTSRTNQVAVSPTLQTLERSTAKEATSSPAASGRGVPQRRSVVATADTSGPVLLIQDDGVNLRGDFELVVAP
jgi:hypothetical protein